MIILGEKDIKYHNMAATYSFPLFWFNNKLLRSYIPSQEIMFKRILSLKLPEIQEVIETDFLLNLSANENCCSPVYEHKNYIHRINIQETYPELIKEMICNICNMNSKLLEHDLIVVDPHEHNFALTIDGFKWFDFGSFRDVNEKDIILRSFVEVNYLIGKYLLKCYHDIQERIDIYSVKSFHEELCAISEMDLSKPNAWIKLGNFVKNIPTEELQYTHWSDEYTLESDINNPESRKNKGKNYWGLLQEIEFNTVTDIACNKGYFGFLAAKKAKSVVGFDYVPKCVSMAYELNKSFKLPIIFATKSIEDFISNKNFETSRFKSDLVVALAIVHHIKIEPYEFIKVMDSICNKYIIIEDINNAHGYENLFTQQGYGLVKRVDSFPLPRSLSLYEKLYKE